MIHRRELMMGLAAGAGSLALPGMAFATAATDKRLIFIIQRGAADGLSTIIPVGDPALASLRGPLMVDGAQKLDAFFALHPSLMETGRLFASRQALFVHAIATPYRDRSHFDAQNVLETGGNAAYTLKTGWLNRLITALPKGDGKAIALAPTVPVALRGPAEVASYAPSNLPDASPDLIARVSALYEGDARLRGIWDQALKTRGMAGNEIVGRDASAMGSLAARLMSGPNGARVAMIETSGWDTHSAQNARMANQLKGLDALIGALKLGLGSEWNKTMVIVATEFGRTVAVNGTGGTDHGTGAAAMVFGGGIKGGRVIADWPGLSAVNLYDGRDLKPTLDLSGLITSALGLHYGIEPEKLARQIFPEMRGAQLLESIV